MPVPVRYGPEFLVNTSTANNQFAPATAALADGRFVVTWWDETGDEWGDGVRAQIYNADGSTAGPEFLVNTTTDRAQDDPSITALPDGGFVISWRDSSETDGEYYGSSIRAQVFGPEGAKAGPELVVTAEPALYHAGPVTTALADGRFIVGWTWVGETGTTIRLQIFNADGSKDGPEIEATAATENSQIVSAITLLPDDRFILGWTEGGIDDTRVRAQIFNADGSKSGAELPVSTTTVGLQTAAEITVLTDGRFVIAWDDNAQFGGGSPANALRAQLFNADGTRSGDELLLKTVTNGRSFDPDITALPDGRFVATWQNSTDSNISAQVFNADGSEAGPEVVVNTTTDRRQFSPTADTLPDGRVVISWTDESGTGGDPDGWAVRGQILDQREAAITLGGTSLADQYVGTTYNDRLSGNQGNDTLRGDAGNDGLKGEDGNDSLLGAAGNDTLFGGNGNDRLKGEDGDDRLVGGLGNDKLTGGFGRDVMTGGFGADDFIFLTAAEIGNGATSDIITDFETRFDDIDLRALDTDGTFIGATAFSGTAGEVRYLIETGIASGDLDGDGLADWSLNLTSRPILVAADFLF